MTKKVRFIYNPLSGEMRIVGLLDYIIEEYQLNGYEIVPYRLSLTSTLEDAFKEEYDHVLVAGGDGSVNLIVNEMKRLGVEAPLAILPAGTANDFAKLLGYSSNLKVAVKQILDGRIEEIDLGLANDRYFVNVLSTGLFTDISQKTPTKLKNTFGKLAYYFTTYLSTIQELPNFKKIHINIDSETLHFDDESLIFFVFNGRTAGNMKFGFHSDVQDGLLDVVIIKGDNISETLHTAFHFLTGQEDEYPAGVVHFKAKEMRFASRNDLIVDLDGEQGPSTPMTIKCISRGIKLIIPPK